MRIALITPYLPAPAQTGGRIRIHRLARVLAARAELVLFSCAGARETARERNGPELALYRSVYTRNNDCGSVPPWVTARRVRRSCPWRLARDLAREHRRAPFDIAIAAHSYATGTARSARGVPLVLDEHNIESEYHAAYVAADRSESSWLERRETELLARWERDAWRDAACVTCVTDRDAEAIRAHRTGPVHVIPNGTAAAEIEFVPPSRRPGFDVLFVGLMSHAPNVAAASFLAREVMPRVRRDEPRAGLILCGRSPAREVLALAAPEVTVTGTVPSVAPYLARAAVYANALFQGAGSSLKVPEALASGVPIVSTALGARGFPILAGEHFAAAETAEEFAHAILGAFRERSTLDTRATRGRLIAETFEWDLIASRFADLVLAIAPRRSTA